uniref:Uncharacterized protein n=1 Tax=Romanomermis culicivorax TaxID=13658 RepID=A0A915KV75_ROMCU
MKLTRINDDRCGSDVIVPPPISTLGDGGGGSTAVATLGNRLEAAIATHCEARCCVVIVECSPGCGSCGAAG